jgi:hypothetical protein
MGDAADAGDRLFTTRWVHLYEEDTPAGEVYAPETGPIPLSRRPRTRLDLKPDGSATISTGGADDRPVAEPARWTHDGNDIVVRMSSGSGERALRIVERSPTRLVITRRSP